MTDQTGNPLQSLTSNRDMLDRLMSRIPGFRGYVEYTEHYNADRIVRMHLGRMLASVKDDVVRIQNGFVKAGVLDPVTECESISLIIEKLIKKIESADFGASSSFSHNTMKLDNAGRERILTSDNSIVSSIDELQKITASAADGTGTVFNAAAVSSSIRQIERRFDERIKIITGE